MELDRRNNGKDDEKHRDTFDKLVFDDLKSNAALVAMLAYLASEEPQRVRASHG